VEVSLKTKDERSNDLLTRQDEAGKQNRGNRGEQMAIRVHVTMDLHTEGGPR